MKFIRTFIEYTFYLFVFLIPWQARYIFGQGMLNGQPWEYGTTSVFLSEGLLVLIAILALIVHLKGCDEEQHYKGRKALNVFLLSILLVITSSVSIFFALDKILALQAIARLFEGILILLIFNELKISLHRLAWFVVASASIQSALAIFQFFFQEIWASKLLGVSHKLPQMLGISVIETDAGRFLRAYGTFSHPNVLAAFLVVGLVMALGLILTHHHKIELYIASLCTVLISSGLFFSFSRSAYLALFVSLLIIGVYIFMNRTNGLPRLFCQFIGLLVAPIILLSVINSPLVFNRYISPTIIDSASVTDRTALFKEARVLVEKNWLKGVGIGNYTVASFKLDASRAGEAYQPVHNVLLLSLVETGLIGALFLLLLIQEVVRIIIGFKVKYSNEILDEMAQFGGGELFKKDYGFNTYWYVCLSGLFIGLTLWFFFDHFFWTLYSGIVIWWLILALWTRMLVRLKT